MALLKGENPYIYGLHDPGGEHLMMVDGEAKGWVLVTEAIGSEAHERGGKDYSHISNQGLGVIVRLNQSYGENGTIPRESRYPEFAQRVANFVADSKGASIWLIGNEMNFNREQPRREGSNDPEPITPRRYATCYKMCRARIKALPGHADDLVVVGSIAPWNGNTPYDADPEGQYPANRLGPHGDYIQYMHDILVAIGPDECDAISIHAYSHGYGAHMVFDEARMGPPFQNYYYNFYTYIDQMNAIPENMRHLPVYLTEMNGDREPNGDTWPFGNNGWIKNAYQEIDRWNQQPGNQQIRCAILFRWMQDHLGWTIDGKAGVQQDFREAIARNYRWQQATTVAPTPVKYPNPYRTEYLDHDTPSTIEADAALTVRVVIKNVGNNTWVRGGDRPFYLAYQWYRADTRQMISLAATVNIRSPLPNDIPPGETVTVQANLNTPDAPGGYFLRWDMLHEGTTWFTTQGDAGLLLSDITIVEPQPEPQPPTTSRPTVAIEIQDIIADLPQSDTEQWPPRATSDINRIVIHHTATSPRLTVQRIAKFQVNNQNKPGITVHFCVDSTGRVFQTQPLTNASRHAGDFSADSVGIYLIGNFTEAPPPQPQLNATAALLAYLSKVLDLDVSQQLFGYRDLTVTQSPGNTWPTWKSPLIATAQALLQTDAIQPAPPTRDVTPTPTSDKPIVHYILTWHREPGVWARWELMAAVNYIAQFPVTIGFSIDEAKLAQYVTILGEGVPATAEAELQAAGCKVERIAGDPNQIGQTLSQLAQENRRFQTPWVVRV